MLYLWVNQELDGTLSRLNAGTVDLYCEAIVRVVLGRVRGF